MDSQLQIAQHTYANVSCKPIAIKQLVQLAALVDQSNTVLRNEAPVFLLTQPVVYRTGDNQYEVLNARQVLQASDHCSQHPESEVCVLYLLEESSVPIAELYYLYVEPARLFGEPIPLIHIAYAHNHLTALLNRHFLLQHPSHPITTEQLVQLIGYRVGKSTINKLKRDCGYTDPTRGCNARKASNDDQEFGEFGRQIG